MRKKLIAGNWKMNMLRNEAAELTAGIMRKIGSAPAVIDIVLVPPYTALDVVGGEIEGRGVMLGAQNVFSEASGAYTGEVSPQMLLDAGCVWVIIGHSERRAMFGETLGDIRKKLLASLDAGLNVILCVGETLEEREEGKTLKIVSSQVESALMDLGQIDPSRIVIAYEPVWAIGTGKTATPDEAQSVHREIRDITGSILGDLAESVRIVYGGSVTQDNIRELVGEEDIDGALVGGASLSPQSFAEIVQIAGE